MAFQIIKYVYVMDTITTTVIQECSCTNHATKWLKLNGYHREGKRWHSNKHPNEYAEVKKT